MNQMERKERMSMVKMEDPASIQPFASFPNHFPENNNYIFPNPFSNSDFSEYNLLPHHHQQQKSNPLGFMELLGLQDFSSATTNNSASSFIDMFMLETVPSLSAPLMDQTASTTATTTTTTTTTSSTLVQQQQQQNPVESSDQVVFNTPATPNSSSISSASSNGTAATAPNDLHDLPPLTNNAQEDDDDDEQHQKTQKQLKVKKGGSGISEKKKKKEREPRIAFMTKSDVDHLEDGYRWRKYGQKAVKNSPFPRSYYRCTSASCNVKKRVERCFNDPSIVVTTYEGQHIHPSPTSIPRPNHAGFLPNAGCGFDYPGRQYFQNGVPPPMNHVGGINYNMISTAAGSNNMTNTSIINSNGFGTSTGITSTAAVLKDYGLLQDIVPSVNINITNED